MRARGRPADGWFFAPDPPEHPSRLAQQRIIAICSDDIPLARPTGFSWPRTL